MSRDDSATYTDADILMFADFCRLIKDAFCQSNHQIGHTDNFAEIHWSIAYTLGV